MVRLPSPTPSSSDESDQAGPFDFMEEPASFRPATPPPTMRSYTRRKFGGVGPLLGERDVEIGLVSGHPLWGHILYPAAIALSRFLELHSEALLRGGTAATGNGSKGKRRAANVLELGAGGGLPGLVAALEGAAHVVISDFPDVALVKNIEANIALNVGSVTDPGVAQTSAAGFTWGSSPSTLLSLLPANQKFDVLLLSDLVFNHSQHAALLDTCLDCLSPIPSSPPSPTSNLSSLPLPEIDFSPANMSSPCVLCFYSHHRPTEALIAADLGFLSLAKAKGWTVTRVWKDAAAGPAFPEDGGDLCIRSTAHGWMLTRDGTEAGQT